MATCNVDVPRHFKDGETTIHGGVQLADLETAKRWEKDGKATILDPPEKPKAPAKPPEAPKTVTAPKEPETDQPQG